MRSPRVVRPLLVGLLTFLATLGPMTAVRSQEGGTPTPVTANREAYFTNSITNGLPPVLVRQVPPGVSCLVIPQLCGPEVDALKTALGLNEGLPLPDVPDFQAPQPVEPGTLPVGMIGGATRYTSLLRFDIPQLPADEQFDTFEIVLTEAELTFSIESPAFRGAILTALQQYPEQNPDAIQAYFESLVAQEMALASFAPTGIEVCIVRGPWVAGPSQDPTTRPAVDCVLGAIGERDEEAGTWSFDIAAIANEWASGAAPNEGIYLGPLGAQNVAYGDPDPSTNFQISLATAPGDDGPKAIVATGDKPEEITDLPIDSGTGDGGAAGPLGNVSAFGAALDNPGSLTSGVDTGDGGASAEPVTSTRRQATGEARTPWWLWLLVPLGAAGSYALAQSLDASPAVATRRPGAMTRLVEARRAGRFTVGT
jgi:hypothetical protein